MCQKLYEHSPVSNLIKIHMAGLKLYLAYIQMDREILTGTPCGGKNA
jgi:hypothetical protein